MSTRNPSGGSGPAERYDRQVRIFGEQGQSKLAESTVAVVGLGGLGSPVGYYLAAAGVGKLVIVDQGIVEESNLNRQILYKEEDIGKVKAESARKRLEAFNPSVEFVSVEKTINPDNANLLDDAQVVVDALDNYETRYVLNEYCVAREIPLVHAAVESCRGELTTIIPHDTPCYNCLYPEPPPTEESDEPFPILGTTAGLFGTLLANETLKLITDQGSVLKGALLHYDLATNEIDFIPLSRNLECGVCGT